MYTPSSLDNVGRQESRMCLKYSTGKGLQHCPGEQEKNLFKAIAVSVNCWLLAAST